MQKKEWPVARAKVFGALNSERDYQDAKGEQTYEGTPRGHSIEEFLLYMRDYVEEGTHVASRVWGDKCKPAMLDIVRKVTALGVACMEQHGAPQRAGFEQPERVLMDSSKVVVLDVTQDTTYGKMQSLLKLLEALPDDVMGFDHSEERGDAGGGYHQPYAPQVISNLRTRIAGLTKNNAVEAPESPKEQITRLAHAIVGFPELGEPSKNEGAVDTAIRLIAILAAERRGASAKVPG